jgi:hypothetical protein
MAWCDVQKINSVKVTGEGIKLWGEFASSNHVSFVKEKQTISIYPGYFRGSFVLHYYPGDIVKKQQIEKQIYITG